MIDTHCHLASEELKDHVVPILQRAQSAGIQKMINIAYEWQSCCAVIEQLDLSPDLYAAVGIQPHDAHTFNENQGAGILNLAQKHKRVVAIGEIGLDAYHHHTALSLQIPCFEYFLEGACHLNLPVVIHVRETHREVLSRLQSFAKKGLRGVIHCFTGTKSEAREFLDCGFFISFSGIVTFKNALQVQESAGYVPLDKILVETDSPYLSPIPLRGKRNEPSHLPHTCEYFAALKKLTFQEFVGFTTKNAHDLFSF